MDTQLYQKILTNFLLSMASSIVPIAIGAITLNQAEQDALRLQQATTKHQTSIKSINAKQSLAAVYPELELVSDHQEAMASAIDINLERPSPHPLMTDRISILEKLILEFLKNPTPHARLWARFIILIATRKDNALQLDQQMPSKMFCVVR